MVAGVDKFRDFFYEFTDQYLMIGGAACAILMEDAGLSFRSTKDLDLVLHVEVLDRAFVRQFWLFIEEGEYQRQQKSSGKDVFYRFHSPASCGFPFMLELFSREPDGLLSCEPPHLTPICVEESFVSLSAILMDEEYYNFIKSGSIIIDDISLVAPTHIIPLKARAWLDLVMRKLEGGAVDSKNIRKHRNDILRLVALLGAGINVELPEKIRRDMEVYLEKVSLLPAIKTEQLGLVGISHQEALTRLAQIYTQKLAYAGETQDEGMR